MPGLASDSVHHDGATEPKFLEMLQDEPPLLQPRTAIREHHAYNNRTKCLVWIQ